MKEGIVAINLVVEGVERKNMKIERIFWILDILAKIVFASVYKVWLSAPIFHIATLRGGITYDSPCTVLRDNEQWGT